MYGIYTTNNSKIEQPKLNVHVNKTENKQTEERWGDRDRKNVGGLLSFYYSSYIE